MVPYEVKDRRGAVRCTVCGRIIRGEGIKLKTCCVNKPVTFCSVRCRREWESRWLRRQEQLADRKGSKRGYFIP